MSRLRKVTIILVGLGLAIFAPLTWYKSNYSMDIAQALTVTVPNAKHQLLIASQGSVYKNSVVEGIIAAAKERQMAIEVIDVSGLSTVKLEDWNVIVILHTWENWTPQVDAKTFLQRHPNRDKIIVLTTSGQGELKMPGVDAITSASLSAHAPLHVAEIMRRIDAVIANSNEQ